MKALVGQMSRHAVQRPQCSVDALVKQVVSVATEAVTPPVDQGCKPDSFDEELPEGQDAVLALIQIDNLEDVLQGLDETQRNAIQSETHQHLMAWCNRFNGFLRKYSATFSSISSFRR